MPSEWEYRKSERFAIRGDTCDCAIDRRENRVSITRKSLLGRPSEQTFPLDKLAGVTIRWSEVPPTSLTSVAELLRTAREVAKTEPTNVEKVAAMSPKGLHLRLEEQSDGNLPRETELKFAVYLLENELDMVALAYQIADAAGLPYFGVFKLAGSGVEVQLSRHPRTGLAPVPEFASDAERNSAAAAAIGLAGLPPFEPQRFCSSHKVEEWSPGGRVVFRRRFSIAALALFPFTLLLLVGPAIVVTALVAGRDINIMNTFLFTVLSAMVGVPALVVFLRKLPSSAEFDWSTRTLSLRRLSGRKSLPFKQILGIEAHARHYESSNDSGGSTSSYACELKVRVQSVSKGRPELVDLLETDSAPGPDAPIRAAFPLAVELAKALGVSHRIEDYSFRKRKR